MMVAHMYNTHSVVFFCIFFVGNFDVISYHQLVLLAELLDQK